MNKLDRSGHKPLVMLKNRDVATLPIGGKRAVRIGIREYSWLMFVLPKGRLANWFLNNGIRLGINHHVTAIDGTFGFHRFYRVPRIFF